MKRGSRYLRLSAIVIIALLTIFLIGSGRRPEARPAVDSPAAREARKLLGAVPAAEAGAWQARAAAISGLILRAAAEGR